MVVTVLLLLNEPWTKANRVSLPWVKREQTGLPYFIFDWKIHSCLPFYTPLPNKTRLFLVYGVMVGVFRDDCRWRFCDVRLYGALGYNYTGRRAGDMISIWSGGRRGRARKGGREGRDDEGGREGERVRTLVVDGNEIDYGKKGRGRGRNRERYGDEVELWEREKNERRKREVGCWGGVWMGERERMSGR